MIVVNCASVAINLAALKPKTQFSRHPRKREINCSRPLPRECQSGGNGMYDQRVRRGSNFVPIKAPQPPPKMSKALQRKLCEAQQRLQLRKRNLADRDEGRRTYPLVQCMPDTVPESDSQTIAVQHSTDQTDLTGYLRLLREVDQDVVKCKTGLDAWTQVDDNDLTTFDVESYPLMELLTAGALEQSAVCVLYEDDIVAERREQAVYENKRLAERVELERLEREEAMARRCGLRALARAERAEPSSTFRAIYGRAMANAYTADLVNDVLGQLESEKYLHGENEFISWFHDRLPSYCHRRSNDDANMNALIGDVIANRSQVYRNAVNIFWDDKKPITKDIGRIPCYSDM